MNINREIVLAKLSGYLNKEISKDAVYEWALFIAVSQDYEQVVTKDPLMKVTIQTLIDINHHDLKKMPTDKALEYYRRCLTGELEYIPLEERTDIEQLDLPNREEDKAPKKKIAASSKEQINRVLKINIPEQVLVLMRIYILIFGVCSIGIHLYSIFNPAFLQSDETIPTYWDSIKESVPHLLYAFLVLLPPKLLARKTLFSVSVVLLLMGMVYYWIKSVTIVTDLSLHLLFVLAVLPFSAIPATLAFVLLIIRRYQLLKESAAQ